MTLLTRSLTAALAISVALAAGVVPASAGAQVSATTVRVAASTTAVLGAARVTTVSTLPLRFYTGPIRMYGDSVMAGAARQLRQRVHNSYVVAKVGRTSYTLFGLLGRDELRGLIKGPVVIHTGNNGAIVQATLDLVLRRIVRRHLVVLVTVKAPRRWASQDNKILAAMARKYPSVVILNWAALSRGHPNWFNRGGIHLSAAGCKAYAAAVAHALHR